MEIFEFHDKLNPLIFDSSGKMRDEVRKALLRIANFFIDEYANIPREAIIDIILTGSNASYSYTKNSDIDLHIVIDPDKIGNRCAEDIIDEWLLAKRTLFNSSFDITIKGMDVEIYPQLEDEPHYSLGIYSILKDKWIVKPEKIYPTVSIPEVKYKVKQLVRYIKRVISDGTSYSEIKSIFDKLKKFRRAGLERGGIFSVENLAFKVLRNSSILSDLKEIMNYAKSIELSVK